MLTEESTEEDIYQRITELFGKYGDTKYYTWLPLQTSKDVTSEEISDLLYCSMGVEFGERLEAAELDQIGVIDSFEELYDVIIEKPQTPGESLHEIAEYYFGFTSEEGHAPLLTILGHDNCLPKTYDLVSDYLCMGVRTEVATNPKTPHETIQRMLAENDEEPWNFDNYDGAGAVSIYTFLRQVMEKRNIGEPIPKTVPDPNQMMLPGF